MDGRRGVREVGDGMCERRGVAGQIRGDGLPEIDSDCCAGLACYFLFYIFLRCSVRDIFSEPSNNKNPKFLLFFFLRRIFDFCIFIRRLCTNAQSISWTNYINSVNKCEKKLAPSHSNNNNNALLFYDPLGTRSYSGMNKKIEMSRFKSKLLVGDRNKNNKCSSQTLPYRIIVYLVFVSLKVFKRLKLLLYNGWWGKRFVLKYFNISRSSIGNILDSNK